MSAAHTPGPWSTKRASVPVDGEYDYAVYAIVDGDPNVIAECFGRSGVNTWPNATANSRLIAAAPDLYSFVASRANSGDKDALRLMESIHADTKGNKAVERRDV